MKRYWILFLTEIKACLHEPISVLGGLILPIILLAVLGLMFSGERAMPVVVINHDAGEQGSVLVDVMKMELSPFNLPYYKILEMTEKQAWEAYENQRIDGVWVIPADFSKRLERGERPNIEMHFTNYMDDRGKNHRIYSAEIMFAFYKEIGLEGPPIKIIEKYPLPEMVDWFWIISVGLVLLSVMLGGMFNIFMLTYKERVSKIAVEFGMSPRLLPLILLPKLMLALIIALLIGTILMVILYLWLGISPYDYLGAVYLLCSLVAVFWISLMLIIGLRARHHIAGAISMIMTGIIVFFTCGALSLVKYLPKKILWFAMLFPNGHAIDPMRDLILFHKWPTNWNQSVLILSIFAVGCLILSMIVTRRQLRRIG